MGQSLNNIVVEGYSILSLLDRIIILKKNNWFDEYNKYIKYELNKIFIL